jgi:hypothetical protein
LPSPRRRVGPRRMSPLPLGEVTARVGPGGPGQLPAHAAPPGSLGTPLGVATCAQGPSVSVSRLVAIRQVMARRRLRVPNSPEGTAPASRRGHGAVAAWPRSGGGWLDRRQRGLRLARVAVTGEVRVAVADWPRRRDTGAPGAASAGAARGPSTAGSGFGDDCCGGGDRHVVPGPTSRHRDRRYRVRPRSRSTKQPPFAPPAGIWRPSGRRTHGRARPGVPALREVQRHARESLRGAPQDKPESPELYRRKNRPSTWLPPCNKAFSITARRAKKGVV